jgi:gas vesicle protein
MQSQTQERSGYGFVIGLLAGTCVGAGLAMWLAPRSVAGAKRLGQQVADQYQQIRVRVSEAVDDIARKGETVREDVAQVVARSSL